jgi:hypothetical protein
MRSRTCHWFAKFVASVTLCICDSNGDARLQYYKSKDVALMVTADNFYKYDYKKYKQIKKVCCRLTNSII